MRYCAGKFKVADHWFPEKDYVQNARLLEYFGYHPTAIRKRGVEIFIDLVSPRTGMQNKVYKHVLLHKYRRCTLLIAMY